MAAITITLALLAATSLLAWRAGATLERAGASLRRIDLSSVPQRRAALEEATEALTEQLSRRGLERRDPR